MVTDVVVLSLLGNFSLVQLLVLADEVLMLFFLIIKSWTQVWSLLSCRCSGLSFSDSTGLRGAFLLSSVVLILTNVKWDGVVWPVSLLLLLLIPISIYDPSPAWCLLWVLNSSISWLSRSRYALNVWVDSLGAPIVASCTRLPSKCMNSNLYFRLVAFKWEQ